MAQSTCSLLREILARQIRRCNPPTNAVMRQRIWDGTTRMYLVQQFGRTGRNAIARVTQPGATNCTTMSTDVVISMVLGNVVIPASPNQVAMRAQPRASRTSLANDATYPYVTNEPVVQGQANGAYCSSKVELSFIFWLCSMCERHSASANIA
mmetsp:Transcript_79930/g.150979  ORF Transcript_79930/g.150979 Transcript_79930/m.150979 type:complete len:153 (-) Transcript_79930:113-571(-)